MKLAQSIKSAMITLSLTGVLGVATVTTNSPLLPVQQAQAASNTVTANGQALATLNSFYKPALKGQFPGSVSGLTVGQSTKQQVINQIGKAPQPAKDADSFDIYGADMGHPGYGFAYKLNKIREIRYFGTNIERQTNIGGITMNMVKQNWFAPTSTRTIQTGKVKQTVLTYKRGAYKLEFVFNSSTNLDHINLLQN